MSGSAARLAGLLLAAGATGGALALAGDRMLAGSAGGGGDGVRAYLLAHPEVLGEAVQAGHDRDTARVVAANRAAIERPFPGAIGGNPRGDVSIVFYMDYACSYCRASLAEIARITADDPGIRIVYRQLPILSPDSRTAAEWGLAAAEQGRFQAFHEAMYAAGRPSAETIKAAAAAAGLDRARAETAVRSRAVAAEIDRNLQIAGALQMSGTPTWVIGDRVLSGAVKIEALTAAVKAARASR